LARAKSDLSGGWGVDIDVEISPIGVAGMFFLAPVDLQTLQ